MFSLPSSAMRVCAVLKQMNFCGLAERYPPFHVADLPGEGGLELRRHGQVPDGGVEPASDAARQSGGSPGSAPVAIGSPERDQSLYEPT